MRSISLIWKKNDNIPVDKLGIGCLFTFITAFLSQFFIEHCTLFFTLVSVCLTVFCVITQVKRVIPVLTMLAGHIMGAIGMGSIPKIFTGDYGNLAGYRSYSGSLIQFVQGNIEYAGRYTMDCFPVWCLLGGIMLWLISQKEFGILVEIGKVKVNLKYLKIMYISVIVLTIFSSLDLSEIINPYFELFYMLVFAVEVGVLFISIFLLWQKQEYRPVSIILASAIIAAGPLMVVSPISPRTFYLTYILIAFAVICLLNIVADKLDAYRNTLTTGSVTAAVIIAAVLLVIAGDWNYCGKTRDKYVKRIIGEQGGAIQEIALPYLPHDRLLQADADSNYWGYVIKDYLGLDKDSELDIEIKWYDWYNWLNVKE